MSSTPAERGKTARTEIKPSTLSPFRYPGGKSRLRATIIDWISHLGFRPTHFVEPFAGGASVGLAVAELDLADQVTLAEIDPDVSAVWEVVLNGQANVFANRIRTFKLTRSSAAEIEAGVTTSKLSRAFRCLLLNRISRGGIMAPGAGWLNKGESGHGIRSRWYPNTLANRIKASNALRDKVTFVNEDGLAVLKIFANDPRAVAFVDPPYVVRGRGAGRRLYTHCDVDCDKLFEIIRTFAGAMVITYHRSLIVERLADEVGLERHTVTVQTGHTRRKRELIMYKSPSLLEGRVGKGRMKAQPKNQSANGTCSRK
jgi:DNA adenine methylase